MANPTTNYGFVMPANTDLVKDLPADFDVFGQAVDTKIKDLNPETTQGDISYRASTANAKSRLGIGTAGQVLTVNSGATAPEWATPTSGGWTSIASGTLSSTSVSIQNISGTYYELVLFINNPYVNTGTGMLVRVNNDSNTVYSSTWVYTDTTAWSNMSGKTGVNWWVGNNASGALPTSTSTLSGFMRMPNYAASAGYKVFELGGWGNTANWGGGAGGIGVSHYEGGSGAITRLDILTENGTSTFSGGTYALYGLK